MPIAYLTFDLAYAGIGLLEAAVLQPFKYNKNIMRFIWVYCDSLK